MNVEDINGLGSLFHIGVLLKQNVKPIQRDTADLKFRGTAIIEYLSQLIRKRDRNMSIKQWNNMNNLSFNHINDSTVVMLVNKQPKCEFIFEGDFVQVNNLDGVPFDDDRVAERYLKMLLNYPGLKIEIR